MITVFFIAADHHSNCETALIRQSCSRSGLIETSTIPKASLRKTRPWGEPHPDHDGRQQPHDERQEPHTVGNDDTPKSWQPT